MTHALFRHVSQFAVSCPVRYESLRDKSRGALRASRSRRLASEAPPAPVPVTAADTGGRTSPGSLPALLTRALPRLPLRRTRTLNLGCDRKLPDEGNNLSCL